MPRFCESPYFLLKEYFRRTESIPPIVVPVTNNYQMETEFYGYWWKYSTSSYVFEPPVVPDEVPPNPGVIYLNFEVFWNTVNVDLEDSFVENSYLMGEGLKIGTAGDGIITFYIKVEDYGFSPARLKVSTIDGNAFHFDKFDIFDRGTYTTTITGGYQLLVPPPSISGGYVPASAATHPPYNYGPNYTFDIYDLTDAITTDIRSGQEIYFKKGSFYHDWLINDAQAQLLVEYETYFDIRKYINTDRQYLYFGKIFDVGEHKYDVIFNGMKDYVLQAIPQHQRTDNLIELFNIYFDQVYQEIYHQQKDVWSLIDPMEIDIRWLDYLAKYYDVNDIIDSDENTQQQREFVRDLIYSLKRKGTYSEYYVLWKILTGTDNYINIYEWWHNRNDIVNDAVPASACEEYNYLDRDVYDWSPSGIGGAGEWWYMEKDNAGLYPDAYSTTASAGDILSTHYRVEADINVEPVNNDQVFPQGTADKFFDMCDMFKPLGRYAHYNLVFAPIGDYTGNPVSTYETAFDDANSLVLTSYIGISLLEVDAYVHTQSVPSSAWEFTHDLSGFEVILQVFDKDLEEIFPEDTRFIGTNTIRLEFATAVEGFVLVRTSQNQDVRGVPITTPTWIVKHNLGQKEVFAQYSTILRYVVPDSIENTDDKTVTSVSDMTSQHLVNLRKPDQVVLIYVPAASASWYLQHNLQQRGVLVAYYDNNDKRMYPKTQELNDEISVIATWETPQDGYAIICYIGDLYSELRNLNWQVADDPNSSNTTFANVQQIGQVEIVYSDDTYDYMDFELPLLDEYNITKIGIFSQFGSLLFFCKCDDLYKKKNVKYNIHFRIRN